ncbi:MAG: beta-ketoacyl synthase N-terminal-like domain-containing protein [bacterium]
MNKLRQEINIIGIGCVFNRGRGVDKLRSALVNGWVAPIRKELSSESTKPRPSYPVSQETIIDKQVLSSVSRADRLTKMAILAAYDALRDGEVVMDKARNSLGIVLATSKGPHIKYFNSHDDILNHGEVNISPLKFTHATKDGGASCIAAVLNSYGPTITVNQFEFPFQEALSVAKSWLMENRCEYVLAGSVDECGDAMNHIYSKRWRLAADGRIKPFQFSAEPESVPGEGSIFFLLNNEKYGEKYCEISNVWFKDDLKDSRSDMCIIDANGMADDESCYKEAIKDNITVSAYSPLFGSMITGSAFNCAAGALMLKNQIKYASPVKDNPHKISIILKNQRANLKEINCIGCYSSRRKSVVKLKI